MVLRSSDYDSQEILGMYNTLLARLEDDDYELKEGNYTFISFYKKMVHIRIERIVKDLSKEFEFETKEQEIAYNSVLKVISPDKLRLDSIRPDGWMNFSKIDAKDETMYHNIAMLVFKGAALEDESIELVKFGKSTYKGMSFSGADGKKFLDLYANALNRNKLICVLRPTGDPLVQIYTETVSANNLILKIRVKTETTHSGAMYTVYMRNLVEAGPRMFTVL